jgi:chaperone modulatory protein CbpM
MATMNQDLQRLVEVRLDDEGLSLDELCRVVSVTPDWVTERMRAGLLGGGEADATVLRFDVVALQRVRWMLRVERDFDAVPELAALVADLQHEIARLRERLRRAGLE